PDNRSRAAAPPRRASITGGARHDLGTGGRPAGPRPPLVPRRPPDDRKRPGGPPPRRPRRAIPVRKRGPRPGAPGGRGREGGRPLGPPPPLTAPEPCTTYCAASTA